jgi:hypothetical protein
VTYDIVQRQDLSMNKMIMVFNVYVMWTEWNTNTSCVKRTFAADLNDMNSVEPLLPVIILSGLTVSFVQRSCLVFEVMIFQPVEEVTREEKRFFFFFFFFVSTEGKSIAFKRDH